MRNFTHLEIISTFNKKNYPLNQGINSINIFGIRNSDPNSNSFDDTVGILYRMSQNSWAVYQYPATTDPGLFYREHPINPNGTAIIIPGNYIDVYKVGLHEGYEAMEQISAISYIRDNNKNKVLDFLYKLATFKIFKEIGKTNIHHAGVNSTQVDNWSAGCQVLAKLSDFIDFMNIVKSSIQYKTTNKFSYTLFEIEDFNDSLS